MCKLYVINLDSDSERMAHLSGRLKEISIEHERISAFDGRSISKDELNSYFFTHHQVNLSDTLDLTKFGAQVGCFLSHFSVWEKVAIGEADYAFVFEDDIHFSPDIKEFIKNNQWLPDEFDIIRLEVSTNSLLLSKDNKTSFLGRNIHQLNSTSWCAGAYVLSKECAKKLISFKMNRFISADAFLFCYEKSPIPNLLNIYQVSPALAIQDKFYIDKDKVGYQSNIETDTYQNTLCWKFKIFISTFSFITIIKRIILGYKRVAFK